MIWPSITASRRRFRYRRPTPYGAKGYCKGQGPERASSPVQFSSPFVVLDVEARDPRAHRSFLPRRSAHVTPKHAKLAGLRPPGAGIDHTLGRGAERRREAVET